MYAKPHVGYRSHGDCAATFTCTEIITCFDRNDLSIQTHCTGNEDFCIVSIIIT
jgi:hypothetical protein